MSMQIEPVSPDFLIAIFDITVLLERYKDSNGLLQSMGFDKHWQSIEMSEGEIAFLHALHKKILWGKLSCNPSPELYRYYLHNSLPIELFLKYLHSKKLDIRCNLHFKSINKKLMKIEWIQQMLDSKETSTKLKDSISELLSEGDIQVSLMECWELIRGLFRERQKAILEIEEGEAKGWVDDEYNSFEGEFLSMDLLGSKKELLPLLQTFIAKYVDHFIRQQIDWGQKNIYQWKEQRKMLMQEFIISSDRYGDRFWTPLYISSDSETKRIESIIALAIEGLIDIEDIGVKSKKTEENLQAKIRMLATSAGEDAKTLVVNQKPSKEPLEKHGLMIWPSRQEIECAGVKATLTGKCWSIVEKCISDEGWVAERRERVKVDIDSDVKDLNASWKNTGWKIAKHRDNKIILGKAKRNRSPRNNPEISPKKTRKSPVAAI